MVNNAIFFNAGEWDIMFSLNPAHEDLIGVAVFRQTDDEPIMAFFIPLSTLSLFLAGVR